MIEAETDTEPEPIQENVRSAPTPLFPFQCTPTPEISAACSLEEGYY